MMSFWHKVCWRLLPNGLKKGQFCQLIVRRNPKLNKLNKKKIEVAQKALPII